MEQTLLRRIRIWSSLTGILAGGMLGNRLTFIPWWVWTILAAICFWVTSRAIAKIEDTPPEAR